MPQNLDEYVVMSTGPEGSEVISAGDPMSEATGRKIVRAVEAGSGGGGGDASSANQQTQITAEQAILAKLTSDPATQTTLAAVLAKLSADPATQTTLAAVLAALNARLGKGAANLATSQGAASTTAGTLAAARATRRSILIRNLDAAITIYVGPATVTAGNGFPILPGEGIPFSWVGLIQVIAASGTPAYALADEFD